MVSGATISIPMPRAPRGREGVRPEMADFQAFAENPRSSLRRRGREEAGGEPSGNPSNPPMPRPWLSKNNDGAPLVKVSCEQTSSSQEVIDGEPQAPELARLERVRQLAWEALSIPGLEGQAVLFSRLEDLQAAVGEIRQHPTLRHRHRRELARVLEACQRTLRQMGEVFGFLGSVLGERTGDWTLGGPVAERREGGLASPDGERGAAIAAESGSGPYPSLTAGALAFRAYTQGYANRSRAGAPRAGGGNWEG